MSTLLRTDAVSMYFGGVAAVDNFTMEVGEGEIRGLIGPNGAGKTTTFNLISGALKPTAGRVYFRDQDISGRDASEVAALGVVRTFQRPALFGDFTVLRNVMVARHLHAKESLWHAILGSGKALEAENERVAMAILKFIGLEEFAGMDAANLPYGHQRALNVAAALATEPTLLMLDEPVAGMNPTEKETMTGLIRRLRDERGITVILVEHDMRTVMGVCDEVTVLDFGKKLAEGSPQAIANDPKVIEAYLGSEETVA